MAPGLRSSAAALAALALAGALGCATALDLDRARQWVRMPDDPEVPVLREEPAADLPPPEGLRASSGELRSVPLKWDPVLAGEAGGYVVERALEAGGPFHRVGLVAGRFDTTWVDRGTDLAPKQPDVREGGGLGDGQRYHYRVRAFDRAGRIAPAQGPVVAVRTAEVPTAPEQLRTYSHLARRVALSWEPVEDPSVSGYVIYRSPAAGGEFRPVARRDGRFATTHVDRSLGPLRVFYYRVAAVNAAGAEGARTEAERAVTKPEPLPPVELRVAEQHLGMNVLAWEPNVEEDLQGYRLLRRCGASQGPRELATSVPPAVHRAVDGQVGADERCSYAVVAVDEDGLESAPSDPVEVESVGYELRAEVRDGAVHLAWSAERHSELASARVLREGWLGDDEIAQVREPRFVHTGVEPGERYRYRVVGVRPDGGEAPPSRSVEVRIPEQGAGSPETAREPEAPRVEFQGRASTLGGSVPR